MCFLLRSSDIHGNLATARCIEQIVFVGYIFQGSDHTGARLPTAAAVLQGVQCTVNNQIVASTLMNMCDHPNHVSIGEVWRPERMNIRIPIFVTGNDFSTIYAPLVRDGRMDKCTPPLTPPLSWVHHPLILSLDSFFYVKLVRLCLCFVHRLLPFFQLSAL